jgi:hypothetical protein
MKKIILTESQIKNMIQIILEEIEDDIDELKRTAIEHTYNSTPVNEYGSLEDYMDYVNNYYEDYYLTKHSSPSDNILTTDIRTPEQMGQKKYNSVDGFFVTKDLNPHSHSSWGKQGKLNNYYVMIPKSLNFLETDYNFSNIPNFYDDFKYEGVMSFFKYNGDKVRELGYDVIVPDGGKNELIVVNPEDLIVLGSIKDIEQWLSNK